MNDLRKRLGIDDWLEIIKEDRVCNGAYISFAQYMYLLEKENKKYKEAINKIYEITNYEYDFYDSIEDIVNDLENILKEVEHE